MSRQSEKGIIGCLLLDNNCISEISTKVSAGMFEDILYREIYEIYQSNYEKGEETDEATIRWVLEDKFPIETINEELVSCLDSVMTTVELKTHAKALISDFKARQANELLQHIQIKGVTAKKDIRHVVDELTKMLDDRETNIKSLSEMTEFKNEYFCDKVNDGINTGIRKLDELLGFLEGGDVIVIGARPSVGKSAFVIQLTTNIARQGKKIAFFNMEMSEKQIYERYISHLSGIGLTRLRRAIEYLDDEKKCFDEANRKLNEDYKNINIITGSKTTSEIRAETINKGYDIIFIDYLQLIVPDSSYRGNRFAEVGKISRDLKGLATELKIPIVALSQLNRVSETRETKEPTMGELRESGNVEQDASVIMLMWNLNEERTEKGLKIDKNRQGKTGKIELKFDGSKMKFTDNEEWEDITDHPFS